MLNADRLRELLDYDCETGIFSHRKKRSGVPAAGMRAGCINIARGIPYERIKVDGKAYKSHRLAWLYVNGVFPEYEIDHINGNSLDNRICNLREVTSSGNCRNRTLRANNTSGVNGVNYQDGMWVVRITHNRKKINLGVFHKLEDAKKARLAAEAKYGYHTNHGRIKSEALPTK